MMRFRTFLNRTMARGRRRGVSMLLVVISLMTATILATAYLSSRDNSMEIGSNVADASTARWAAASGLEMAIAVLETETDWRTEHVDGVLFSDISVGVATVSAVLTDMVTDSPPDLDTEFVRIEVIAVAGGIEQRASAEVEVRDPLGDVTVAVDLSEFTIFAIDSIEMENRALVDRWGTAPANAVRRPISLGTRATASLSVDLRNNAAAIDARVYHSEDASDILVSDDTVDSEALPDRIPVPDPPRTGVDPPSGDNDGDFIEVVNVTLSDAAYRFEQFQFGSESAANYEAHVQSSRIVVDDNFRLYRNSGFIVENDLDLIVFNNFTMDRDSYIEVADGANLRIFVKGNFEIEDAYIGEARTDRTTRDSTGDEDWMDPRRIAIYSIMDEDAMEPEWRLLENSIIKGQVYAPNVDLRVRDDSAIYGRIAVRSARITNNGAIFADHALDSGAGYTNLSSVVYGEDGEILQPVHDLPSLSPDDLEALAEELGLVVRTVDAVYGVLSIADDSDEDTTPRIVPVTIHHVSAGYEL